jgi:Na+-driven multidrug efflux pump
VVRSILICLLYTAAFSLICGGFFLVFGRKLLGLYNPDPTVITWGMERLVIMMSTYCFCGIMDAITGALRGLGHSVKPTITTILGACGLRIFWVIAVFPHFRTLQSLSISYPVSWIVTGGVNGLILFWICRKMLLQARDTGYAKLVIR